MSKFMNSRFQQMTAYTPGEQPKVRGTLIKLNTNESPYPPPPGVLTALTPESIERLRLYSDLSAKDLTSALADDLSVEADQIALGNGSDEVLYFAMMAFGESGATYPDITYGFYTVWAKLLGIDERIVPLKDDFTIDVADYQLNDRMVVIANPNAPTGIALPPSDIEIIVKSNPDRVVLIDEAYVDFGGESAVSLIDRYDNMLVCRTFSKSRQMAGARLGYLVGPAALIADIEKIRYSINPYNINSLTQAVGAASVRDKTYFRWACDSIIRTREWTTNELNELGFVVLPSCANFVFAKPPRMSGEAYMQALRAENIVVRHFGQPRIADYVRITIGTDAQMQTFIETTKTIIGGVK